MDHTRRPSDWRPEGTWDRWVDCDCGGRHWGAGGAAGLLLVKNACVGPEILLQHRAAWTHQGDTWGVPGGALRPGESAWDGAVREAQEEAGIDPAPVVRIATWSFEHPDWRYTTVLAHTTSATAGHADAESATIEWVSLDDVPHRDLHPAFGQAWPTLATMLSAHPAVVVDAANVVGSRPDRWWKDRVGATRRLLTHLDTLAATGIAADLLDLPGQMWWPPITLVTEGQASAVHPAESDAIVIIPAPTDGDTAIVAEVATLAEQGFQPTVVTADRGLIGRIGAYGARHLGPRTLWENRVR